MKSVTTAFASLLLVSLAPLHAADAPPAHKPTFADVPCELVYPGAPDVKHVDAGAYLLEKLK